MSNLLFIVPDYENAFVTGAFVEREGGRFDFRVKDAGDVKLISGHIIAADPYILVGDAPFTLPVPQGTFPVRLALANVDSDERVALARIDFAKEPVVYWEMALLPGQEENELEEGEIYGFTTDAGTACFMDKVSAEALRGEIKDGSDFFEELMEEMDDNFESSWAWANLDLEQGNIVTFMSGYGNGYYATYYGRNEAGKIVALVTDFDVIPWQGETYSR